jgi:hypothetical protein
MRYQRGASMIGWLIILAFIGMVALVTIRVVPVYLDAYTVRSVLKGLQDDRELASGDRGAILRALQKRFEINDVKSVTRDDISIQSVSGGTEVVVDYEARFSLIANIDGIARFTSKVTIRN